MKTQAEKMRLVMDIIIELEREHGGIAPLSVVKKIARDHGVSKEFVDEMLEREFAKGRIYSPVEGGVSTNFL